MARFREGGAIRSTRTSAEQPLRDLPELDERRAPRGMGVEIRDDRPNVFRPPVDPDALGDSHDAAVRYAERAGGRGRLT